jgi:cysteinyl-tRNA synthetase
MDLMFPHHECELAQNTASRGQGGVHYWMHNNMITIKGQKMGKSLGNFITLEELFTGKNQVLDQAYSPMTIRFFILQAHYRSPLDFSNEALQAAEKGYRRMMQAARDVKALPVDAKAPAHPEIASLTDRAYEALCDDLNTPIALSVLFDAVRLVNSVKDKSQQINAADRETLEALFSDVLQDVLGLQDEIAEAGSGELIDGLIGLVVEQRSQAKAAKDWATSDRIRNELQALGVQIKDTKDGCEWTITR